MAGVLQDGNMGQVYCKTGTRGRCTARQENMAGVLQDRKTGQVYCKTGKQGRCIARLDRKTGQVYSKTGKQGRCIVLEKDMFEVGFEGIQRGVLSDGTGTNTGK